MRHSVRSGLTGVALVVGSLAAGAALAVAIDLLPDADPSLRTCAAEFTPDSEAFDTWWRTHGPLDYRSEGIWLDRDGREIGYADAEDGMICAVA